ncbi:MAG: ABC transporter permease [Phycisphaerales bacterium]
MMYLRQTWAIFVDAYLELNAKRLFWVTFGISALMVAAFAGIGINEKGITILWWELPIKLMAELYQYGIINKPLFYKFIFLQIGFQVWLTWAATILALISTAGIIPDFVTGGSIELSLSRPIGRLRLFLTKYATGLLFVALQVGVFTGLAFLVIGIRGGEWVWTLFWGVPLVLAFFSFIYCVMVLVGLLTRSTMASLVTACVFWLALACLHAVEGGIYLQLKTQEAIRVDLQRARLAEVQADMAKVDEEIKATPPAEPDAAHPKQARLENLTRTRATWETTLAKSEASLKTYTQVHAILYAAKTVLPKTSETMELLSRWLITGDEVERFIAHGEQAGGMVEFNEDDGGVRVSGRRVRIEMAEALRGRSVGWVLGTSLAFEAVILGAACWVFCRRDF